MEDEPTRGASFDKLVLPYLGPNPPESWELIDNADPELVKRVLEELILRILRERLFLDNPRVDRLVKGDWSFGHDGMHRGKGTKECPREPHHHHDQFCKLPTIFELQIAGIDPKKFKVRSRA